MEFDMTPIQAFKTTNAFIFLGLLLLFVPSIDATEKDHNERNGQERRQGKITQFLSKPAEKPKLNNYPKAHIISPPILPTVISKPRGILTIDLTKDAQPIEKKPILTQKKPLQKPKETSKVTSQVQLNNTQERKELKRPSENVVGASDSASKKLRKTEPEMQVSFLQGSDAHIEAYAKLIDEAESHIIIASWNVNFITKDIFSSLLDAKRRGVHVGFIVNSIKREETLNYFYDDEEDEDNDSTFTLFETKSHAKFLFVDSKSLILGSFNALGESFEESDDASFMIKGTINQLWPFYMSIYETYTSINEYPGGIFDGIALISKARNPGERRLLQRSFDDGSQIFLLRTLKEHEDFFKLATPNNGSVTIYSPFSTKDNTLKRLKTLESLLVSGTEVHLKVLQKYENGLTRLLNQVPGLRNHTQVHVATSHQKIVILGDHTICAGSLNWLSAAQDLKDPYGNVELSVVLQGSKAENIIKKYYNL
jgi:hypothetical protein